MTPPATMKDIPKQASALPTITIYGPHECPNCDKAMKLFDRQKPPMSYTKVDIEAGDENHARVTSLGYQMAPVIFVELPGGRTIHWGGHRPDMLTALVRLCTKGIAPEDDGSGPDEQEAA